jgi:LmbE family N-acetylglucosaminyl deacetylase
VTLAHPTVLGVFPHPDDESYAAGGTLARAARTGSQIHVLALTRGEFGQRYKLSGDERRPLSEIRSAELSAACCALGVEAPRFLDLPDGQVARANFPSVVARLVALIRELRPQVVISLGPDGVYGHPDHVAAYRLVVAAVGAAGGGARFPQEELGRPHTVERLLFTAFPQGMFRPQYDLMLTSALASEVRLIDPRRLGTPSEEVAVDVDVRAVADLKLAALACHATQFPGDDPRGIFPPGIVNALLARERFTIFGAPGPPLPLHDIFDGLSV